MSSKCDATIDEVLKEVAAKYCNREVKQLKAEVERLDKENGKLRLAITSHEDENASLYDAVEQYRHMDEFIEFMFKEAKETEAVLYENLSCAIEAMCGMFTEGVKHLKETLKYAKLDLEDAKKEKKPRERKK